MTKPTGEELAEYVGHEDVECDKCGFTLGTHGGCIQCIYAYESRLKTYRREQEE